MDSGVPSGPRWGHKGGPRVGGRKDLVELPVISRLPWTVDLPHARVSGEQVLMPGEGSLHP